MEDSRFLPYEFADYLRSHDALEEVLGECPAPLMDKLRGIISPADERYRAQTREDGGRSIDRFYQEPGRAWWWQRRPYTGQLGAALGEGENNA